MANTVIITKPAFKTLITLEEYQVTQLTSICRQAFEDAMDGLSETDKLELELNKAKALDIILDRVACTYDHRMSQDVKVIWRAMCETGKMKLAGMAWGG